MHCGLNDYLRVKAFIACQRKENAFALLQAGNHGQQIIGARIALVAEHAHQAFRVLLHFRSKGFKPYGGVT